MADVRNMDADRTGEGCDESHVGAALWGVAAALVHLHGATALTAVLGRPAADDEARFSAHVRAVLWRLGGLLGQGGLPLTPEIEALASK